MDFNHLPVQHLHLPAILLHCPSCFCCLLYYFPSVNLEHLCPLLAFCVSFGLILDWTITYQHTIHDINHQTNRYTNPGNVTPPFEKGWYWCVTPSAVNIKIPPLLLVNIKNTTPGAQSTWYPVWNLITLYLHLSFGNHFFKETHKLSWVQPRLESCRK